MQKRIRGPNRSRAISSVLCECGDHCFLNLNKGYVTILDPQDDHITKHGSFWASVKENTVYVYHRINSITGNKTFFLHREILNAPHGVEVDHKEGDGLDNRRRNLRIATRSQNARNRKSSNKSSSRFLGVTIDTKGYKEPRWVARIQSNKRKIKVGTFLREEEAAVAYDKAAVELHGEFARLNFPNL